MNNQQLTPEQNYQVLLDALKYTSDIVVTLTEKNTLNENKISSQENKISSQESKITILEKIAQEQKNMINKNTKLIEELGKKILQVEKNSKTISKNTNTNTNTNTNNKIEFDTEFDNELNSNSDIFDLETINNTINNTNILSDVTSFNLEEIENFKKQKTATSLVENLIKRKQELENKINDLTSNPDLNKSQNSQNSQNSKNSQNSQNSQNLQKTSNSVIKSYEEDKDEKELKSFDINAIVDYVSMLERHDLLKIVCHKMFHNKIIFSFFVAFGRNRSCNKTLRLRPLNIRYILSTTD